MRKLVILPLALLLSSLSTAAWAGWDEGVAAFKAGNLPEAARQFQAVTEELPDWPDGYFMLGQVLTKMKKNQEALNASRKAYDLNPGDARYQLQLATAYIQNSRYRDAAQLLQQVNESSLNPQQKQVYNSILAVALDKTGQSGAALDALRKAAQGSPNDAAAQFNYGAAAFNAGKTAEAVAALEKSVSLDGKDVDRRQALVDALLRSGRETLDAGKIAVYSKAASHAKTLATQTPSYENLLTLGEAQLGAQQYAEAITSFGQAAEKNAREWIPHYYMGQASTAKADFSRAETQLQQALQLNPPADGQKRVWLQLGFVYEKQRNFAKAEEAYAKGGNAGAAQRAKENAEIAKSNAEADRQQAEYDDLKKKEKALQDELKKLGTAPPGP